MGTKLANLWYWLRSSLWLVPSLLAASSFLLYRGALALDASGYAPGLRRIYAGNPDGARDLLTTIASSMIAVAGVVFSITIVALSLASSRFGPRLLRNFMRDVGNQTVLGTFIGAFAYCLLALQGIRGGE